MMRSLQHALKIDLGFNPHNAATLGFDLGIQGYPQEKGKQFLRNLARRAKEVPGVESAALASTLPLDLGFSNDNVWDTDQPKPLPSKMHGAQVYWITPDFFRTMETRLVAGRDFTDADDERAPPTPDRQRDVHPARSCASNGRTSRSAGARPSTTRHTRSWAWSRTENTRVSRRRRNQ